MVAFVLIRTPEMFSPLKVSQYWNTPTAVTTPIATLNGPSGYTYLRGCSVDPTTGDRAMKQRVWSHRPKWEIVFPQGSSSYGIVQGKDPEIYDVTLSVAPSR